MAVVHKNLTGDEAIHPAHYQQSGDPGAVGDNKDWIDTTSGSSLTSGWIWKIRAVGNAAWTTVLDLATKANIAAPTFTGDAKAVTPSYGDNDTSIATSAFVQSAISTRVDSGNSGTTKTLDWSASNLILSTLTGNVTYTFTAPSPALGVLILEVVQGSGPFTTTWPAAVHWASGTPPTLTATSGKKDIFTFYYIGSTYYGVVSGQNYTA